MTCTPSPAARAHACSLARAPSADRSAGLHRAVGAGALVTTTESVLMELIRSKDHPNFKAISGLLKTTRPEDPLGFM